MPTRDQRGNAAKRFRDTSPGPWKRWKTRDRAERAIRFIETYCRAPTGVGFGRPIKLAAFQKDFLRESLRDGIDAAFLSMPRGNGKSSLGGALAVWALFDFDETGAPQVPIVATTIEQAERSCYGVAVSMIEADDELDRRALIYRGIGTRKVSVGFNRGTLFPVAHDPPGLQGLNPSFALVDEIGFQPIISWNSLRQGSGKRPRSLIMGIGTPGLDRDNALYFVRKRVHEGAILPRFVFREYEADADCDLLDRAQWRKANPAIAAGFLQEQALEGELGGMPEGHFRIFRLGQWIEGTDCWLGANGRAVWDALRDPWQFVDGAPTYVGLDVAIVRDSTAVVAIQQRPDGHWHAKARLWIPTTDVPVDVTDVMGHLRELAKQYDVRAISYDPRFFDVPAQMLADEGLPVMKVPQSPETMTPACGSLLEVIKQARMRHDGDEAFATHVLNAVPRLNERGFTLQKSKSRGRIDACIALALALERALHQDNSEPLFAWA